MTAQLATLIQNAIGSDYRVEQELDGGGMSRLFLATDLRHNRRVVVKVLTPELMTEQSTARFKREIELTVRLQHPHILPILTSGAWEDTLYYITPFIPGESLRARIARDGKLPLDDIVKILRDVSGALAFAHQRGIVHRDIKPGNILLADGHAILADFGIARAVSTTATPLTGSGMVPGTPAYMAPELPTDEKADVYALGVVAYEMLCGGLPPRDVSAKEVAAARTKIPGDDASRLRALSELIADALARAPERRVQSAAEFHRRIELSADRRAAMRWWIGAAAIVILGVGGMVLAMRPPHLDADRYLVIAADRDSSGVARNVQNALLEWRGITVADLRDVEAEIVRHPSPDMSSAAIRRIARRFHARNAIIVETQRQSDSLSVRATLTDVAGDSAVRSRRVSYALATNAADRTMEFRRLVNGVLRAGTELPWVSAADDSMASLPAWREYDRGRQLLREWNLAKAESSFRAAAAEQERVAPAHLWLAQTLLWADGTRRVGDVRSIASRAMALHILLSRQDSLQAAGDLALASQDYRSVRSVQFAEAHRLRIGRRLDWSRRLQRVRPHGGREQRDADGSCISRVL